MIDSDKLMSTLSKLMRAGNIEGFSAGVEIVLACIPAMIAAAVQAAMAAGATPAELAAVEALGTQLQTNVAALAAAAVAANTPAAPVAPAAPSTP